MKAINTTKYL